MSKPDAPVSVGRLESLKSRTNVSRTHLFSVPETDPSGHSG